MKISKRVQALLVLIVFIWPVQAVQAHERLIILHTNDLHGRIETGENRLGMPYIAALNKYYGSRHEHVLLLDAGDTIHGRPITDGLKGKSAVASMNAAGYEVMVPGNHDFNFGWERLLELEADFMQFSLVAANVFNNGELLFDPYVIKTIGDFRVGIFGLVTPETLYSTHPKNIEGIRFGEVLQAAEKYSTLLREEYKTDLVVALGHIGISDSEKIARQVEGIHLFVDGHSHTMLKQGRKVCGTLIVQAHEYGNYLGKVEIDLSKGKPVIEAQLISADEALGLVEPDARIQEMLEEFRAELSRMILENHP